MKEALLTIRNLSHTYMKNTPLQQPALREVSMYVGRGECIAVIGHTGSGKSTLIQHLNALLLPQSGEVTVDEIPLHDRKPDVKSLRRKVGLVFQNPEDQIFEKLVGDDVAYGPFKMGYPLADVRDRVRWAMDLVGLPFDEFKDRPTFALSGGQKRKVALAGVLALKPELLVLDEPAAGLDPRSRNELLGRIRELNREEKVTVVFVTHNMEEVASLADRVYVLDRGKVAAEGTPRAIFGDTELLSRHQIGPPEAVEILHDLHRRGYAVDPGAYKTHEAAGEILSLFPGRG